MHPSSLDLRSLKSVAREQRKVKISPQRLSSSRPSLTYHIALSKLVGNRGASSLYKGVVRYTTALMTLFLTVILSDQKASSVTPLGHNNGVFFLFHMLRRLSGGGLLL